MLDLLMNGLVFLNDVSTRTGFCKETIDIWKLIGTIVFWIQIAIPVLIILLGTIDLGKAVLGGDDKKIKEAQKAFLMRLIYGAAVFFVVFIVRVVFSAIATAQGNTSGLCWACVARDNSCK